MYNFLLATTTTSSWLLMGLLLLLLVAMIVLPSISQNKKVKQYREMQTSLKVGDKVQTIGGVIGRITRIQDKDGSKSVFLETGDKKSKITLEFDINAIAGPIVIATPATAEKSAQEAPAEIAATESTETTEAKVEEVKDETIAKIEETSKPKTAAKTTAKKSTKKTK